MNTLSICLNAGHFTEIQFSSVQSLSCVWLFETLWTTARQPYLSITNSQSLPKLMSIEWVMPTNHLILCHPLLLLTSILPRIRIFSNESVLRIRWPKYWSFSFNISPSNEYSGLTSFRMYWLGRLAVQSWTSVWLFETPWTAALQASLSSTISPSLLKLMSIESVMPTKHLIFCPRFSFCLQSSKHV